ncbi:MAG: O-antigen ligase family protein [Acetivibrionales bacterium]|jgi:O-antigen ligase
MPEEQEFYDTDKMRILLVSASVLMCAAYVFLCTLNTFFALIFAVMAAIAYCFMRNPDLSFAAYVFLLPFVYSPFFYALPGPLSAFKLQSLLLILTAGLFILYKRMHKTGGVFKLFVIILPALYAVGWIRSGDYMLKVFSANLVGKLPVASYLFNYASWTVLSFAPFLMIGLFCRTRGEIEKVIRILACSTMLIAGFMAMIFLLKVSDRSNFEAIRAELAAWTGMHGNDISNYCVLSFPVILAWAMTKKSVLSVLSLCAIVASTSLTFSRTGYLLIIMGLFLYLMFSGKLKWLPVTAIVLAVALVFFVPDIILERAVMGLSEGDANELSAGRVDFLWVPLIHELFNNPQKILFGMGRYGITRTDVWMQGRISNYVHAHNAFLDCVLDMGIIGLGIILILFAVVIVHFFRTAKKTKETLPFCSNLLNGCLVSVICFLIAGMTGRSFFPNQGNFYLWIVLGLGFSVARLCENYQ